MGTMLKETTEHPLEAIYNIPSWIMYLHEHKVMEEDYGITDL
jgi:hypothetical protein